MPGDVIKARVHSYGDSRKIQLTTIEEQHGVVFAKSQDSGVLLFPVNWTDMVDPVGKGVEKRKVAKPEDLDGVLEEL